MRTTDDIMLVWAIIVAFIALAWLVILLSKFALPLLRRPRQWDFHEVHLPYDD